MERAAKGLKARWVKRRGAGYRGGRVLSRAVACRCVPEYVRGVTGKGRRERQVAGGRWQVAGSSYQHAKRLQCCWLLLLPSLLKLSEAPSTLVPFCCVLVLSPAFNPFMSPPQSLWIKSTRYTTENQELTWQLHTGSSQALWTLLLTLDGEKGQQRA